MNLRDEILKEHSKRQTLKIVRYIDDDQNRFDELMKLFLGNEYRVTQRAAWAVSYCAEAFPFLLKKHLKKMILNLAKPVHIAVKRNTIRVLQFIDIPESLHGITVETCFKLFHDLKEPIAVRVFSMTVLANLCKHHPELANELKLSIETRMPYDSAGFCSRAKKIMKELNAMQK
ncbi:MAG: hypothetical protein NT126_07200 [Bacteroidetes bacterium]|nr:hypothetical protein [Bacteroidota bacterium]